MKENLPNLLKEIDSKELQEPQRVPNKLDPRKHIPRHIIIILPKIKHRGGELPQSGKGNRLPESPGSSESPKQVGPKEAHSKAHHNYITQGER